MKNVTRAPERLAKILEDEQKRVSTSDEKDIFWQGYSVALNFALRHLTNEFYTGGGLTREEAGKEYSVWSKAMDLMEEQDVRIFAMRTMILENRERIGALEARASGERLINWAAGK